MPGTSSRGFAYLFVHEWICLSTIILSCTHTKLGILPPGVPHILCLHRLIQYKQLIPLFSGPNHDQRICLQMAKQKSSADICLNVQAAYLDSILFSSFRWSSASRVIHSCWAERADLYALYADVMQASGLILQSAKQLNFKIKSQAFQMALRYGVT